MKIVSLHRLAEESAYAASGERNLQGSIDRANQFKENLAFFEPLRDGGIYAFFAFHPVADKVVLDYVAEGTAGDDAGPHILALFLSETAVSRPRQAKRADFQYGVALSSEAHPAYDLAREFFPKDAVPRFPGLIFFDALFDPTESIYVLIPADTKEIVRTACRKAFEAANRSWRAPEADAKGPGRQLDFDRFASRLFDIGLTHHRTKRPGVRAAALIVGVWMKKNVKSIVCAIPKLVEVLGKGKTGGAVP